MWNVPRSSRPLVGPSVACSRRSRRCLFSHINCFTSLNMVKFEQWFRRFHCIKCVDSSIRPFEKSASRRELCSQGIGVGKFLRWYFALASVADFIGFEPNVEWLCDEVAHLLNVEKRTVSSLDIKKVRFWGSGKNCSILLLLIIGFKVPRCIF